MATEDDIALGVMKIALANARRICTFKRAYTDIPSYVRLNSSNTAPSATRIGEVMWQQLVRNIKSHDKNLGNFIERGLLAHIPRVGFQLTKKGERHLKSLGY